AIRIGDAAEGRVRAARASAGLAEARTGAVPIVTARGVCGLPAAGGAPTRVIGADTATRTGACRDAATPAAPRTVRAGRRPAGAAHREQVRVQEYRSRDRECRGDCHCS